jgi:hypothetical protein
VGEMAGIEVCCGLTELGALARGHARLTEQERMELDRALCAVAGKVAGLLDELHEIDPDKGPVQPYGGTRNRQSYQYRVRLALRFTYP